MAKRWYVMHVYSGFEKKAKQAIMEKAEKQGLTDSFGGYPGADRGSGRGSPGRQGQCPNGSSSPAMS